jgi:hypothetical protein
LTLTDGLSNRSHRKTPADVERVLAGIDRQERFGRRVILAVIVTGILILSWFALRAPWL